MSRIRDTISDDLHGACKGCGSPNGVMGTDHGMVYCGRCRQDSAVYNASTDHLFELLTPTLNAFLDAWENTDTFRRDPDSLRWLVTEYLEDVGGRVVADRQAMKRRRRGPMRAV